MKKKAKKETPKKKGGKKQLRSDVAAVAELLALVVPERTNGLDAKTKLYEIRDRWGMQL